MTRVFRIAIAIAYTLLIAPGISGQGAGVQALFSLDSIDGGPFPSDWFTVPDHTQNTHRRVALESPDCTQYVSD